MVENPDTWIDFEKDRILFDGKPLEIREKIYLILHKPVGYITTFKDPEGRPTVYDLIRDVDTFVSPVGRLDLETSGLLIMTNDTQLAERLTNPEHKVAKTYLIGTADMLCDEVLDALRSGVELSDGMTRPARVRRVAEEIEIIITEGRNRQVRRMIEAVGSSVVSLVRTQIGTVRLAGLESGEWRKLDAREIATFNDR